MRLSNSFSRSSISMTQMAVASLLWGPIQTTTPRKSRSTDWFSRTKSAISIYPTTCSHCSLSKSAILRPLVTSIPNHETPSTYSAIDGCLRDAGPDLSRDDRGRETDQGQARHGDPDGLCPRYHAGGRGNSESSSVGCRKHPFAAARARKPRHQAQRARLTILLWFDIVRCTHIAADHRGWFPRHRRQRHADSTGYPRRSGAQPLDDHAQDPGAHSGPVWPRAQHGIARRVLGDRQSRRWRVRSQGAVRSFQRSLDRHRV